MQDRFSFVEICIVSISIALSLVHRDMYRVARNCFDAVLVWNRNYFRGCPFLWSREEGAGGWWDFGGI